MGSSLLIIHSSNGQMAHSDRCYCDRARLLVTQSSNGRRDVGGLLLLGVRIIAFESSCQNRDARRYLIGPTCQSSNVATGINHRPVATVNLKRRAPLSRRLFKYATDGGYKMPERHSLSLVQPITLSLSKLYLLQIMASNDNNDNRKLEKEAESSMARKRLRLSDANADDDDSSESPEDETREEVSSKEMSMNQLDTSEEKLQSKHIRDIVFGDTTSSLSEPRTPKSHRRSRCPSLLSGPVPMNH
jgi:hypothetical protein